MIARATTSSVSVNPLCLKSAERFWDVSIQEAKHRAGYEKLSPAEQKEFDQDPFGFAFSGEKDLVWEEAVVED